MAIVFAQPTPFAPQIAAQYAAAEQQNRILPLVAGAYGDAARIAAQVRGANADREAATNRASYGNIQSSLNLGGQLDDQEAARRQQMQMFEMSRQPSERDYFNAQVQQGQNRERLQLQAQLATEPLRMQEQQRLALMKARYMEIQSDTSFTPQQKQVMLSQIEAGMDAPMRRQELAMQRAKAEQASMMMEQMRQQVQLQNMTGEQFAQKIGQRIVNIPDPMMPGGVRRGWLGFDGKFNEFEVPKMEQPKPISREQIFKEAEFAAKAAFPDVAPYVGKSELEMPPGVKDRLQQYYDYQHKAYNDIQAQVTGQPSAVNRTSDQQNLMGKPFDPQRDNTWTPTQKIVVDTINNVKSELQKSPLPKETKDFASVQADMMLKMVARHGSYEALLQHANAGDPQAINDIAVYNAAKQYVGEALKQAKPQEQSKPPAPARPTAGMGTRPRFVTDMKGF